MNNLVTLIVPPVSVDTSNESIPYTASIDDNRVTIFNKVADKIQVIYYLDRTPTNVDVKVDSKKRLISAIGCITDNTPTLELRYPEVSGSCVLKRFNNIAQFKLKVFDGVVLFINNQPLKAVYDATKSKCDIIWAEQVVWTFITPTEAHAKLLFLKLRPTFVVTKELISFTRKPNGQMNPQYETKLTAITPTSQGKVIIASVVVSENGFTPDNQYNVDGDYMVGVKVKRDNKERVCLIALNDDREIVVNYPYQGNTVFENIGKADETTWAINVDGTLIDATVFNTAIELLGVSVSNPGTGGGNTGGGTNPGTGTGDNTGTNPDTGTGGNTGGETGGTDNPPVQEVKPSYLKLTGYVISNEG